MLGLHIVSFTDATLVTLSWSHALLDGMGWKALLDAWTLMLKGCEDDVLPAKGLESDLLATLGTHPTEPYRHVDKQFNAWQMVIFGWRYLCDQIFWQPKDEGRVICVPPAHMESLRDAALRDIKKLDNVEKNGETPFLSDGDILCAWWTRHILLCLRENQTQTIAINIAFGLRWLLAKDLLPANIAYVANAVTYVPTFMAAKDVLTKPLGYVAAALRGALAELGTRKQIEARLAIDRTSQDKSGSPALFGDPWMHMVVCTNWTKGKFYDVDFSGAVTKRGCHVGEQQMGRPSYIQLHAFAKGFSLISGFSITGKDADGNYWLYSVLRKEYWAKVEQALRWDAIE